MAGTTVLFPGPPVPQEVTFKASPEGWRVAGFTSFLIKFGTLLTIGGTGSGLPAFPTPPVDPNVIYTIEQPTDGSGDPAGPAVWNDGLSLGVQQLNDQINGGEGLATAVDVILEGLTNGHSLIQFQGAWDGSLVSTIGQAVQASDGNTYVWTEPSGTQGFDPTAHPTDEGWQILPDPSNSLTAPMAFAALTLGYDPSAQAVIAPQGTIFLNGTNVFFNVDGGHIWVEITANTLVVGSNHSTGFTAPVNQISTITATCAVALPSGPANGSVLALFCTAGAPTITGTGISETLAAGDKAFYMWSGTAWVRTSYLGSLFDTAGSAATVQTNLNTEATTRATADSTNATNIATEATNRATAVSGEATARAAADTAAIATAASDATAKVATETTNRTAADALLTPLTRSILTGFGMAGGGTLAADRTITKSALTTFLQTAATQAIPTDTWTSVAWSTVYNNESGAYDGTHNTRIYSTNINHLFNAIVQIAWDPTISVGDFQCRWMHHSNSLGELEGGYSTKEMFRINPSGTAVYQSLPFEPLLATTADSDGGFDYVQVRQTSGSTGNIVSNLVAGTILMISHAGVL